MHNTYFSIEKNYILSVREHAPNTMRENALTDSAFSLTKKLIFSVFMDLNLGM